MSGHVPHRKRSWSSSRPFRTGLFITLLLLCVVGWYYQHRRDKLIRALQNQTRTVETQMELTLIGRVTRDYRIEQGNYPEDFAKFLGKTLRANKKYGPGRDFWGRPYLLEVDADGFVARSAGIDGRYHTRDDLICRATVRE